MMSEQEIKKRIENETRRKKHLVQKIAEIKADVRATNKALHFWEAELKNVKRMRK